MSKLLGGTYLSTSKLLHSSMQICRRNATGTSERGESPLRALDETLMSAPRAFPAHVAQVLPRAATALQKKERHHAIL